MKKNFLKLSLLSLCLLAVILSSIYYLKIHYTKDIPENTLQKAFNQSGANFVSGEIYFKGKLKDKNLLFKDIKESVISFSKELGIQNNKAYSEVAVINDSIKKFEVTGTDIENNVISVCAYASNIIKDDSGLSVSITTDLQKTQLTDIRKQVELLFKKRGIKAPQVNSCITGNFDGKMENSKLNEVCVRVFKDAKAKKVEGLVEEKLISVSGYSPAIGNSILVNGKEVNMNLAIRYNSYEKKTYIWLATPVITTEY